MPPLHAFLGIDEQGDLQLYASPWTLNPVGKRCEKGNPLPKSLNEPTSKENALTQLLDLAGYFRGENLTNAVPEFGSTVPKPKRTRK